MTDARSAILGELARARRRRGTGDDAARRRVEDRLGAHASNLVPARAMLDLEARLELFRLQAEAVETTVERVARAADLPALLAAFLRRHNLPLRLVVADDPALAGIDFGTMLEVARGRAAAEDDLVGVTVARAGVAETGTVLIRSSEETPTTLAFLPDTVVMVLESASVLASYEEALRRLLDDAGGLLPRSANFVTGPSRTADIEQTLQLGAHGPRRLLVVLVDRPLPPAS